MKKSIADHMIDIMIEKEIDIVWYGDLENIHECAERSGMYNRTISLLGNHPLNISNKVLSALQRSDKFEEVQIKHIGRPARAFKLKKRVN